jgi:hypothetical protein
MQIGTQLYVLLAQRYVVIICYEAHDVRILVVFLIQVLLDDFLVAVDDELLIKCRLALLREHKLLVRPILVLKAFQQEESI